MMFHLQGNRGLIIALFLLILSVYLATYSGRVESGDSLRVADAVSSLVHFNDTLRDETVWEEAPQTLVPDVPYPFVAYEPGQPFIIYAASIPFRIAEFFPHVGLIHAMWLLNIFVGTLAGVCFFMLARLWGYAEHLAIAGTLVFALGTIVWPYSKTLFREPLVMLLLLITVLGLEKWKRNYWQIGWLLLAVVMIVAAYFTKDSSVFAIPALIVLVMPKMPFPRIGAALLFLGIGVLLILAFVPGSIEALQPILQPIRRFNPAYSQSALQAYLFSIGGSIWATSPILLAGFGGVFLLFRQGERQRVFWIGLLLAFYSVAHALFTEQHWFGGLSWPPRFLVPVVPFLALLLLPVLEWLMQPRRVIWRILLLLLFAYSLAIQVIASISWQDAYVNLLPGESGGLIEWQGGLNDWRYLRWLLLPQGWSALGFDIAWMRSGAGYFIGYFLVLALIAALLLWQKRFRLGVILLALLSFAGLGFGLRHLYFNDAQYWANKPALFEALQILEREAANGEPLLMAGNADVTYDRFIMNYNRLNTVRPVSLGFPLGEVTSPDDSPELVSNNPTDLFHWDIPRMIDALANRHERLWWLGHNSEFTPWAIRVEQRYLVQNYYLLEEYKSDDPYVRLLEFSTVRAPNPYDFRLPEHLSELQFGDSIYLNGFTLPLGIHYAAGDVVPISFFWQTDALLSEDYTMSWFIVHETGAYLPIQGLDSQAQAGFALTQHWQPNQFVIDNRAIELPMDIAAGNYLIWLRVYLTGSQGIQSLPITSGEAGPENLGILPIRLIIN